LHGSKVTEAVEILWQIRADADIRALQDAIKWGLIARTCRFAKETVPANFNDGV
jgi:hypothetical protein